MNRERLVTVCSGRQDYGDDGRTESNNHCVWRDVGYMHEMWRWVESDEHFKSRQGAINDSDT